MLCKSHPHRYCSVFDEKKKKEEISYWSWEKKRKKIVFRYGQISYCSWEKKKKKRRRGNFVMRRFRTVPEKKKMQFVFGEITVLEKRKEKKIKKSFRVFSRWVFVDWLFVDPSWCHRQVLICSDSFRSFEAASGCLRRVSGGSVVFTGDLWQLMVFSWLLAAFVVFWYFPPTFELSGDVPGDMWCSPARLSPAGKFLVGLRRVVGDGGLCLVTCISFGFSNRSVHKKKQKKTQKKKRKKKRKGKRVEKLRKAWLFMCMTWIKWV